MAENLRTRQVTYIARFWISLSPTTTSQKKYRFFKCRPITAVKPSRARLVPGWETAWEYPVL